MALPGRIFRRVTALSVLALSVASAFAESRATAQVPDAVRQYAPRVWLHSKEPYRPMSARKFISKSRLLWHRGLLSKTVIDSRIDPGEVARLGVGCVQVGNCYSFDGISPPRVAPDLTRPHEGRRGSLRRYQGFVLDFGGTRAGEGVGAPAYYVYRPQRYVAYWFHYAYSSQGVGHEGDWEHIAVRLDGQDRATHLQFFLHRCHRTVAMHGDKRPEVFSALRSHATYLRAGRQLGRCKATDRTNRGTAWDTRDQLVDAEAEPWYGFGGAWGRLGKVSIRSGPLGPSRYKGNCSRC